MMEIYGAKIVHGEEYFVTAFPTGDYADEMPQDFPTWADAQRYINEEWEGNGVIESPC